MKIFIPDTTLAPFLESFWYADHHVNKQRPRKIIPDGICEIIINMADPYQISYDGNNYQSMEGINLFFARDKMTYLIQGRRSKAIGIRLKPFSLYMLIGQPLRDFATNTIPLRSILPELNNLLVNLPESQSEAIQALHRILINALDKNLLLRSYTAEAMYQEIEQKKGVTSIGYLIDHFGISYKACERLFLKHYGVAPKRYVRYRRLHFALNEINRATSKPDFLSIVAKYAFHDQAHLVREFIDLTGVSPLSLYEENNTLQKFYGNIKSVQNLQ